MEPEKNVAGVAIMALLAALIRCSLILDLILKLIKISNPEVVLAAVQPVQQALFSQPMNLLGKPFSDHELIPFAAEGERVACGAPIADNVAPALLGGFTLVKETDPIKVVELPSIEGLYATIIHPQIEIKTSLSRDILPQHCQPKKCR